MLDQIMNFWINANFENWGLFLTNIENSKKKKGKKEK